MYAEQIRQMIADAVREDARTGRLASVLVQMARGNGRTVAPEDVANEVEFIRNYVEGVPGWLETLDAEATKAGMAPAVAPVLQAALQYFLEGCDFIPDHLGLIGLVDDAYLALRMVEVANEHAAKQVGRKLVDVELGAVNSVIRTLIGDQMAGQLEAMVAGASEQTWFKNLLTNLSIDAAGGLPLRPDPHPIYSNPSAAELVRLEMGRHGVTAG
jgi:uncharacterized membrane protein YkvA (DUF1232 family)